MSIDKLMTHYCELGFQALDNGLKGLAESHFRTVANLTAYQNDNRLQAIEATGTKPSAAQRILVGMGFKVA